MQYESYFLYKNFLYKIQDMVHKKPFFKMYILKKGGSSYNQGHLIFGTIWYYCFATFNYVINILKIEAN